MTDVDELIRISLIQRARAIQTACEYMLVNPKPRGVLVETWSDGRWKVSLSQDEAPMQITYREHDTIEP